MRTLRVVLAFFLAAALSTACAVRFQAELLNPLNKSGRTETSAPEQSASPEQVVVMLDCPDRPTTGAGLIAHLSAADIKRCQRNAEKRLSAPEGGR